METTTFTKPAFSTAEAEQIADLLEALKLLRNKGIITKAEYMDYALNVLRGEG